MTMGGQSIGISIGMFDILIRTALGLKRGAPSRAGPEAIAPLATLKRRQWLKDILHLECGATSRESTFLVS
jgi:hypothetical protein